MPGNANPPSPPNRPLDPFEDTPRPNPQPPGQAPIAVDDQFLTNEDTILIGDLLADNSAGADSDPNDDTLTVTEVDGEAGSVGGPIVVTSDEFERPALLTVTSSGGVTFDPQDPQGNFDFLAAGEDDTLTFTYTISDGLFLDTATATVTIQGVNDPVEIGVADLSGAVTEDETTPALTDSGTIGFSDVDLSDVHEATAAFKGTTHSTQLGTLTASVTTDTTGTGTGGVVTWNFSVDNEAVQLLKAGDTITETHTVTLTDSEGSTVTQDVTVTINGVDEPDIDALIANSGQGPFGETNQVQLNDGSGAFTIGSLPTGVAQKSFALALGDLDGDGDLDAFIANRGTNQVLINQGGLISEGGQGGTEGTFSSAPTPPGGTPLTQDVALGDLDGDGDLDAFLANDLHPNQVLLNNGTGTFTLGAPVPDGVFPRSTAVALGDLDGDGDLDAFVGNQGPNQVLINQGGLISEGGQGGTEGTFSLAPTPAGGGFVTFGVALGDLDSDGDLDAFLTNTNGPHQVLLNNGSGTFSLAPIQPEDGILPSWDGALGDVDGDGDLDAFVVNLNQPNQVLLNDGSGTFTLGVPPEGDSQGSTGVALADLDGDGDLDAFITNSSVNQPNQVLINDGSGEFTLVPAPQGFQLSQDVALGDLDGDGEVPAVDESTGLPNINQDGLLPSMYVVDVDAFA